MGNLGNLASRLLVAAVAIPFLLLIFYQESPVYTWLLVFAATLLALREFYVMALSDRVDQVVSVTCGAFAAASLYWLSPGMLAGTGSTLLAPNGPTITIVLTVLPITLYYLFRFGDINTVGTRLAYSITGIAYIGLLLGFLALLKRDLGPAGGDVIVFVLLVTWLGDTGAYFAGRFLGKAKLYPTVSPKKTWAGAIGGLATSALSGVACKLVLMPQLPWIDTFAMAVPGAILGQMGDLVESLLKRSTGVKDSGSLLPGHGGVLDRCDAVLFMAPYVYFYLIIRPVV